MAEAGEAAEADFLDPLGVARGSLCDGRELDAKSRFSLFTTAVNQAPRLVAEFHVIGADH